MNATSAILTPTSGTAASGERFARSTLSTIPSVSFAEKLDAGPGQIRFTISKQLVKAVAVSGTTSWRCVRAVIQLYTQGKGIGGSKYLLKW